MRGTRLQSFPNSFEPRALHEHQSCQRCLFGAGGAAILKIDKPRTVELPVFSRRLGFRFSARS